MIAALRTLAARILCRHSWRYSKRASRITATEVCRHCGARRRWNYGATAR